MAVRSYIRAYRCFRPLSRHWKDLDVSYVSLWRILGRIPLATHSYKYMIIIVMASVVFWEIRSGKPLVVDMDVVEASSEIVERRCSALGLHWVLWTILFQFCGYILGRGSGLLTQGRTDRSRHRGSRVIWSGI